MDCRSYSAAPGLIYLTVLWTESAQLYPESSPTGCWEMGLGDGDGVK